MHGLGNSVKRPFYIESLIRCMHPTRPHRVRHTALRAVCEVREELASITSASPRNLDARLLNGLSRALLTAVRPNVHQTTYTGPDTTFYVNRDSCYILLLYALTKNDEWCQRLTRHGHLDQCTALLGGFSYSSVIVMRIETPWNSTGHGVTVEFYFLVIFGRIKSLGKDIPFSPAESLEWLLLIARTWDNAPLRIKDDDYVDGIPAVVTATKLNLTASDDGVPREWLVDVAAKVLVALVNLRERQGELVNKGIAQAAIDDALSSMERLHTEFSHMVEQRSTLGNCGSLSDRYMEIRRSLDGF
ncbi:hypothetical protein F4604DRAFT_1917498 [Suillus subluteus]|nr:hypothetical protein F4604DRAFT_1917498 [Suillus subluteus]